MTVISFPVAELPANSTDRLMAVADIVESRPDSYRQGNWWTEYRTHSPSHGANWDLDPTSVYGKALAEPECRTTGCIAGWAVALSPQPEKHPRSWTLAGAAALGLSESLSAYLFSANLSAPAAMVADILRRIARLPEGERTFTNMALVLSDEQLQLLLGIGIAPDDDDEDDDDDDVVEFEPAPVIEDPDDVDDAVDSGNGADNEDVRPVLVSV